MRFKPRNAVILLTGIAALFYFWGPSNRFVETPDVVRRFSEMQVGQRMHYEIRSGNCFVSSELKGWLERGDDAWQQSVRYLETSNNGRIIRELDQQLGRDINFLGALSASIYRLGPPNMDGHDWIDSFTGIRLDWNDNGEWDQEWSRSDRPSGVAYALMQGTDIEW